MDFPNGGPPRWAERLKQYIDEADEAGMAALDDLVAERVTDAIAGRVPGAKAGGATFQSATAWTTTNTDGTSVAAGASGGSAALIPGLAVPIVGNGGVVEFTFNGLVDNSSSTDHAVGIYWVINKNGAGAQARHAESDYTVVQTITHAIQIGATLVTEFTIPEGDTWVIEPAVFTSGGVARVFGYNGGAGAPSKTKVIAKWLG